MREYMLEGRKRFLYHNMKYAHNLHPICKQNVMFSERVKQFTFMCDMRDYRNHARAEAWKEMSSHYGTAYYCKEGASKGTYGQEDTNA
jgi:hypothetical protein